MMGRRIQILSDAVANQIAAGEVVERPASAVKELVENALDAGARMIQVEVEAGGKRRIRVADDGFGMVREDAVLALDRHATSKIVRAEDLQRVVSFGFRGEALPSIAAVSRFQLVTQVEGHDVGTEVRAAGGRITSVADAARTVGTTVEVQGLFYNAPARARFLKSAGVEARAVSDVLNTLALTHPEVGFRLDSNGQSVLEVAPAADLRERLSALWGHEAAQTLLPVFFAQGALQVSGYVQRPDAARPGHRRAQLFVNGRPFRDPALLKAAERGFRTTIAPGQRPWIFLHLQVPGDFVDVNVHPAKAEVRFRQREAVEELIEQGVRSALTEHASAAPLYNTPGYSPWQGERQDVGQEQEQERGFRDLQARETLRPRPGRGGPAREPDAQTALFVAPGSPGEGTPTSGSEALAEEPPVLAVERPKLHQVHRTWIIAESRDGVMIIDQHSAHERVLFERLMNAYGEGGAEAQRLLFPITIRLTPGEVRAVTEVAGLLARAGFEVEAFGADTVIVQTVPNPHPWFDAERCFREMVAELTAGTSDLMRAARNQHERIAMTFACKGAIKAGQVMSQAEMQELFEALFATQLPWHDVHGRPTVVRLSVAELERKFGR